MQREAKISNYFFVGYCGICLLLLSLPLSGPVASLKAGVVYVLDPTLFMGEKAQERLAELPAGVKNLILADQENQALRAQVKQALWLQDSIKQLQADNARLSALLGLKVPRGWTPVWARVVGRDPSTWYHSFLVDAGEEEGVSLDDPVLGQSASGLAVVGRVIEARPQASVILLLTDELSSVAAVISSGTVEGLIQGQGDGRLLLNYLPPEAQPQEGGMVYTSMASAVFPGGLPIGTVIQVKPEDPFLAVKSAEVRPAISARSLTEVAILVKGKAPAHRAKEAP